MWGEQHTANERRLLESCTFDAIDRNPQMLGELQPLFGKRLQQSLESLRIVVPKVGVMQPS